MSQANTGEVVLLAADPVERAELTAAAGFLAGYCGTSRTSYSTDLRILSVCCTNARQPSSPFGEPI